VNYEKLIQKLLQRAKKKGAQAADVYLEVGRQSSCRVRDGQIEHLTESASKGLGIRVFVQGRLGFTYTSDFNEGTLLGFVDRAVDLAKATAKSPHNGLPLKAELASKTADIGPLFDRAVAELTSDWKVKAALEAEKAAKAVDPRVTAFDGVGAGDYVSEVYLGSTGGFLGHYHGTYVYVYASPVASENGQLQTASWMDYKRFLSQLDSPESVGREAARRAVRMLGAKKVKSQKVPVVFDPRMAASFVGSIAHAANGDLVLKKASVLAGKKGKKLASSLVSIVDDGTLEGGIATAPFDGEGVPTRKTHIVKGGKLESYLYDAFTARKAKARSTGNADRGYSSLPGIGTNNLYLEKGSTPPEEVIKGVKQGLYVTAMLGRGADPVSGDFSRGANGLWIENGQLAYPVQEITVAGNMLGMLEDVDAVGTDLEFRGSVAAPTVRFRELTVSGA
jgi:PmbA protein